MAVCYTIGHSTLRMEQFLDLLRRYDIKVVVDVRSSPYSKYSTQFNRENIDVVLEKELIAYRFAGDALGARRTDKSLLFEDGVVDFAKVREKDDFMSSINSVAYESTRSPVAIMCAEKDPYGCHRFVLVSKALVDRGVDVKHILSDGTAIDNRQLENRLRSDYAQRDLFSDFNEKGMDMDELYKKRNREIGYKMDVNGA